MSELREKIKDDCHVSFPISEIFSYSVIGNSFEFEFSSYFFEAPHGQISWTAGDSRIIVREKKTLNMFRELFARVISNLFTTGFF